MPPQDPWLTQRMADYTAIRRAEATLYPAIAEAVATYLRQVHTALLGTTTTGVAFQNDQDPPDLNAFPDQSTWTRLVTGRIAPAVRAVFTGAYQRLTGSTETARLRAQDHTDPLPQRLAAFPRNVWQRLRNLVADSQQRGEPPAELRARIAQALNPGEWEGQTRTMTRTATTAALNAGALSGAVDEQTTTGRPWTKRWQATLDQRVRHTHRQADGQARPLFEPFTVGGFSLQFPGDPTGPPEETINCRCSVRYTPTDPGRNP